MGVIPLKIRGEMTAVGFTSYYKMHGIKRRLEHLMGHHRLRSIRNNYRTHEATFSRVEIKETYGINYPKSKSLLFFFSPWRGREKTGVFRGYCRDKEPKNICWVLGLV